ncbi:DUF4127 family protein [Breznakiella homolactica]|uniref:DUF4127 family protein n=1 Tax=Breznakiella homolactica TaxID=2798577 RepID=A0A7T8B9N2_9SPIR|nr:DUF4127 family protein [Breznakiella homolactica]QQO08481.1 DUF4127 family protein [Breznakiella homolactica]
MNPRIVYLPLDERPCNYDYPQTVARIGGAEITVPPMEIMGNYKIPADTEALWEWLLRESRSASHAVVSMDLLCYGGIVPSRLHHSTAEECARRANRLGELKGQNPGLRVYAFQLITRAPARNGSGEEPDYYEHHGYDIFRYGVISDKENSGAAAPSELSEKEDILRRVPGNFLEDFLARREINFLTNTGTIDLASRGIIDHLVIPLDDCAEYGFAPAERRRLALKAAELVMLSKISMYPGADEMGCTLIARALCDTANVSPKFWVEYSSNTGKLTIPPYEDRTIGETVPHHIRTAGASSAKHPGEADIALMVNPPTAFSNRIKFELDRRKLYMEPERNLPAFMDRIKDFLAAGSVCAVADCAVPDGADQCLMVFLKEQNLLGAIHGYSGWNTSSNAMGTAVAHAAAVCIARKQGSFTGAVQELSDKFRFSRYIEDWGYMTQVRQDIIDLINTGDFGPSVTVRDLDGKGAAIAEEATRRLRAFAGENFAAVPWDISAEMPWNRMFEIRLTLTRTDGPR